MNDNIRNDLGGLNGIATAAGDDAGRARPATQPTTFERKQVELQVYLFPSELGNVLENVRESIRSLLLKYSDRIGGVLLAFDNVKLLTDEIGGCVHAHGLILNEMPHVHYRVGLDALVFCPIEGVRLTGVINECFPSHVGLLVHCYFNAMVSSDQLQAAGYVFDQDLYQWIQEEGSQVLGTTDTILFTVQKLHECEGVVSIEGSQPEVVV